MNDRKQKCQAYVSLLEKSAFVYINWVLSEYLVKLLIDYLLLPKDIYDLQNCKYFVKNMHILLSRCLGVILRSGLYIRKLICISNLVTKDTIYITCNSS